MNHSTNYIPQGPIYNKAMIYDIPLIFIVSIIYRHTLTLTDYIDWAQPWLLEGFHTGLASTIKYVFFEIIC